MSIINEALKKTQLSRKMNKDKQEKTKTSTAASSAPTPSPTLKKQPIEKKSEPVKKSDFLFTWKMASILTVTALLVIMALGSYQRVNEVKVLPYAEAVIKPLNKELNKVKVAFEGVFLSDDTKIALINKKSLHVGDAVSGMKIIAINSDTVDLQGDKGIIQLHAGATYLL